MEFWIFFSTSKILIESVFLIGGASSSFQVLDLLKVKDYKPLEANGVSGFSIFISLFLTTRGVSVSRLELFWTVDPTLNEKS